MFNNWVSRGKDPSGGSEQRRAEATAPHLPRTWSSDIARPPCRGCGSGRGCGTIARGVCPHAPVALALPPADGMGALSHPLTYTRSNDATGQARSAAAPHMESLNG